MSSFASIKFIKEYEKVVFYSVVINGGEDEESLFEAFVKQHTAGEFAKLNHILAWIRQIGNQYGAKASYFRHEMAAEALPPNGINKEPTYIEEDQTTSNNLRLYCHRLNDHVVILYGGAIKTAGKAQDCPQVKEHFNLANILSRLIDQGFVDDDIEWNDDDRDILYNEDFKINY
ncbi:hypothetical protein [Sphingobacterium sp.]|uniref:hypothetical protein n=1 Tax=Sphingobacterium sp. TaxID=341027 RepID=UPI0028A9B888|nr:hypothetical protein [Sphingobacterium sp.]